MFDSSAPNVRQLSEKYSKSVLLVDDDPADRKLIARILRKGGFNVLEVGTVDAAMANIVSGRIGCVITDQIMPISGLELAQSAQQVRGDVNIVFISGGAPRPDLPKDATFVSKGDFDNLLGTVQECMEKFKV